jgi:hypothetical protein
MPPAPKRVIVVMPDGRELHCDMDETFVVDGDIIIAVVAMHGDGIMLSIISPDHKWPWIGRAAVTMTRDGRIIPPL